MIPMTRAGMQAVANKLQYTTGNMPAVTKVLNENEENWKEHLRNTSCFWVSFTTPPIADLYDFNEGADELFDQCVQTALQFLEDEKGCRMRITDVKMTPLAFVYEDNQVVKFFCLLLAVPLGKPKKGAKRQYKQ